MKESTLLSVVTDLSLGTDLIMHPNDGFDLGLLNLKTSLRLFINTTIEEFNRNINTQNQAELILENKCKHQVIMMSKKNWEKLGKPHQVKLFFDSGKLLIAAM